MIIAERKFLIESSQERIWELILKAVLRFMPFERIEILSDRSFRALLRIKMGFISLPMNVEMSIMSVSPPESLVTVLKTKGMLGMVWLNQKATFRLTMIEDGKTEVACKTVEEGMATLLRVFLLWKVKSFAEDAFKSLEERLRQWA